MVAGNTPCATAAWAPALEARSLARLGRRDDALAAVRIAETAFARLPADQISDTGYGYAARQLRQYLVPIVEQHRRGDRCPCHEVVFVAGVAGRFDVDEVQFNPWARADGSAAVYGPLAQRAAGGPTRADGRSLRTHPEPCPDRGPQYPQGPL